MKKILLISPHFPPVNAPDMQRIRLSLPHFRENGWEPTVLAIAPEAIEGGVLDPWLERTYPADIRVIRVKGVSARFTRWAGVGNLWWRCGREFTEAGDALLEKEHFDVAFFSTTQFSAFSLGPRWLMRHGLPYVLDYQDPWVNDYYRNTKTAPPGGRLKFALSQWTARLVEPRIVKNAAAIIAVSEGYGPQLASRIPEVIPSEVRTIPFGAAQSDFTALADYRPEKPLIDFTDGLIHHVYAGRCGPDMTIAMSILFSAFARFLKARPEEAKRMRFHFIGTDYSPPPLGRDWAVPIAEKCGVREYVNEHRYRVRYFDALYYLKHAASLIAVGSNDPTYSASKFFPYVLAQRPMILIFHEKSPVLRFATELDFGTRFAFSEPDSVEALTQKVFQEWFMDGEYKVLRAFNRAGFEPYTAKHLTAELSTIFEAAAATEQD